jgi:hypothetical protein
MNAEKYLCKQNIGGGLDILCLKVNIYKNMEIFSVVCAASWQ